MAAREGSALIVVLWVIGLLSILVSSFAFDMHVEAQMTSFYKKRTKAERLAMAGITRGEWLLTRSTDVGDDRKAEVGGEWWFPYAERIAKGGTLQYEEPLGDGTIRLTILPEPARRNVNQLTDDDWKRILETAGVPDDRWDALISAVRDWMDADDQPRPNGAETDDYYAHLKPPYKAKNGPLDTVDELRLIKGFHPENEDAQVPTGTAPAKNDSYVSIDGFADLLTVFGNNTVNVNAASRRVLMTLPGMTESTADDIIAEREGAYLDNPKAEDTSFKDVTDLFNRVPGLDVKARANLSTATGIYRIESIGVVGGVQHKVWCIAQAGKYSMRVLRWLEGDDM